MRKRFSTRVGAVSIAAAAALIGLVGAAAPAGAAGWKATEDAWESSKDKGGWDAQARITWDANPDGNFAVADFVAYGDTFYVANNTGKNLYVTLSASNDEYYESFTLEPGKSFTDNDEIDEGTDVSMKIHFKGSSCGEHDQECAWAQDGIA